MKSLIMYLFRDKKTAAMLLVSSLIIGICALAPSLFVIIVLNKYLASGVTATLVSLAIGAVLAILFEFGFRQNRGIMITEFNQRIFNPLLQKFSDKFKQAGQLTAQQYKKLDGAGTTIKNMVNSGVTGWILDWPFVLGFVILLIFLNWTAAVITAIFMLITLAINKWKNSLSLSQEMLSNIEIFLMGLLTISIMTAGALMIMQGKLDIGVLIGSNILAARAFQGTNKYAKGKEFLQNRERAVSEVVNFVKQ